MMATRNLHSPNSSRLSVGGAIVAMSLIASYAVRLWEHRGVGAELLWRMTTEVGVLRAQS